MLGKLIYDYLQKYSFPYPIDKKICSGWAKDLPSKGETILYTSCMYQTASLSEVYSKFIPYAEKLSPLSFLGRFIKPSKDEIERAYRILNKIAQLLKRNGINFAYLYEEEPYSGAILLELGYLDEFGQYAKSVYNFFKNKGIKRIITVDPHTHNALSRYNEFVEHFDLEIVSYLELVKDVKGVNREETFVIHDSCLYSRFLNLRDVYRDLINKSGIKIVEDELITGVDTSFCCGSPIKPINPDLSDKIAKARVEQLSKLSKNIIVVCPMCYANLSKYGNVKDWIEVVE
ncbi:(Fe-S)-binding protein [Sulfurisphaera ohwakuensis]|uniref:(Fe-S)-binding protein n=1 Tax=Sulfurisphaera ohwakuensis TaxID=69656 RepID=A0A650CHV9_SULOH|nr:(Fe-S)-binding protein [Sulfurisphaera ohwakuensis]MBB5253613.1 Fe-S oxidoreductase [Sulfurisphaera ohwakuensis]QGR17369.1 (Fe-S)-binding protein [Sulfurisphaera ohwakuensis]